MEVLPFQSLKCNTTNLSLGQHVLQKRVIGFANALVRQICQNGTFRIFYAKLPILLPVGGSTNRRKEIILRGTINVKYGKR